MLGQRGRRGEVVWWPFCLPMVMVRWRDGGSSSSVRIESRTRDERVLVGVGKGEQVKLNKLNLG